MAEKEKWITVNGAHIPIGEGGNLQGKTGNKIEKDCNTAEKVKKTIDALKRIQSGEEEVTVQSLRNDLEEYGGTNDITFMKGDAGKGVTHLIENGRGEYLADIFTTVATGKIINYIKKDEKIVLEQDNIIAILRLYHDGKKKSWLLTGYDKNTSSKKERKDYQTKQKPASDSQGKGYSRHLLTQTEPRLFRSCLVADSGYEEIITKFKKKSIKSMGLNADTIKKEFFAQMREVRQAVREVKPLIGDLDYLAFDSTDSVYLEACRRLNVPASLSSSQDVVRALCAVKSNNSFQARFDR